MAHDAASHPEFPHIVLGDGTVVQLVVARRTPRLVARRCRCGYPWCYRWPQWWQPFRIGRRWRLTVDPADAPLLKGYLGHAAVAIGKVALTDEFEFRIPGVKVIRP